MGQAAFNAESQANAAEGEREGERAGQVGGGGGGECCMRHLGSGGGGAGEMRESGRLPHGRTDRMVHYHGLACRPVRPRPLGCGRAIDA